MDIGRRPYKTACRFLRDDDTVSEVSWEEADPKAETLPFPSIILSRDWENDRWDEIPVGEVTGAPRVFQNVKVPAGIVGDHNCGTQEEFGEGGLFDDVTPLAKYGANNYLICCLAAKRLGGGGGGGGKALRPGTDLEVTGTAQTGTAQTSCPLPAMYTAGELLVVTVMYQSTGTTPGTPSGWTLLGGGPIGGTEAWTVTWYRAATGSEGAALTYSDIADNAIAYSMSVKDWSGIGLYTTLVFPAFVFPNVPSVTAIHAPWIEVAMGLASGDSTIFAPGFSGPGIPFTVLPMETSSFAAIGPISGIYSYFKNLSPGVTGTYGLGAFGPTAFGGYQALQFGVW